MNIETRLLKGLFVAAVLASLLTLSTMLVSPAPFAGSAPVVEAGR
ncbi:hypothetical protein [Luteibacter sp. CQ10]